MKPSKKFDRALKLFNANKLADARKLLQKLTGANSRDADVWQLLGMTDFKPAIAIGIHGKLIGIGWRGVKAIGETVAVAITIT